MKKDLAVSRKSLNYSTYGYDFSRNELICVILFLFAIMCIVCYINKLNMFFSLICALSVTCSVPFVISAYFKHKFESNKFEEYCMYFEYMKVFFKTYNKIILALEHTQELFKKDSHMYECIDNAINEINTTGDYKKALEYIEKDYANSYLIRLHNLLIVGEEHGSNSVWENIDTINYDDWKEDMKIFEKTKKSYKFLVLIFVIASVMMVFFGTYMSAQIKEDFYLQSDYQLYTFVGLTGIILMFVYMYIILSNKKWIRSDD